MSENPNDLEKSNELKKTNDPNNSKNSNNPKNTNNSNNPKNSNNSKAKKKKRTAASYAIEFFIKLGVTIAAVLILLVFFVHIYVNHSNSSYPRLADGDLCITYLPAKLTKGKLIAYSHDGEIRFARIVACAGETVDISGGIVKVNGYDVLEDTVYETPDEGAKITFPYTVPEGKVFVLNDFREDKNDSRFYGGIDEKDTKGVVIFVMRRRGI